MARPLFVGPPAKVAYSALFMDPQTLKVRDRTTRDTPDEAVSAAMSLAREGELVMVVGITNNWTFINEIPIGATVQAMWIATFTGIDAR